MKPFTTRSASYLGRSKKNETVRRFESMGLGGMDTMLASRNCRVGSCGSAAITTLDHQALCLNHFLSRCYEKLENLEPRCRKFSAGPLYLASTRSFIEYCSRTTL